MAFVYHTKKKRRRKKQNKTKLKKNKTNSVRTQPAKDDATRRCTHVNSTNRFDPNKKRVENTRTKKRKNGKYYSKKKTRMHAYRHAYWMPMDDVLVRETDDDCMPLRLITRTHTHWRHSHAHYWHVTGKNDMWATHDRSAAMISFIGVLGSVFFFFRRI